MLSFSIILSVFVAVIQTADSKSLPVMASSDAVNKTLVLKLVNDARRKGCGCGDKYYPPAPALVWNDQLEKAAVQHSNDMLNNKYFSHTDKKGNSAGSRIRQAGYRWRTYGENIAHGYGSEKAVVEGWLNSPGHCSNIMSSLFKEMGVAKAGSYWTQTFATK